MMNGTMSCAALSLMRVMAMQRLGATDEEISFRLEVATNVLDGEDPDVEAEMKLIRQTQKPFSFD
jgi:hypothetical protein